MATNQVLHGSNRVVEHPNRYKLNAVAGQSNVYDLEKQAGVITDNGTPYNKNILDKIDNVLSYLKPSIVKTPSESGFIIQPLGVGDLLATSVDQSWSSSGANVGSVISGSLKSFTLNGDTYTPTYSYVTSLANGFEAYGNSSVMSYDYHPFNDNVSSTNRYTNSYFLQIEQRTESSSNPGSNYHHFMWVARSSYDRRLDKIFDMKIPCIPTFKYLMNASNYSYISMYKIFGSNNKQDWTELTSISNNVSTTYTPNDEYRYFMFSIYFNGSSSNDTILNISHNYISEVNVKVPKYDYNYILDNNTSFTNNQRLLIQIPQETDLTELALNKINNIDCDTILKPSKEYGLIYNQSQNKFLLDDLMKSEKESLFDITLSEAVNQVDLVGISDKLKIGKLYEILIIGTTNSNDHLKFGTNYCGYSSTISKAIISLFSPFLDTGILSVSTLWEESNTGYYNVTSVIQGHEYIKCDTASVSFNAGTRIIIKEVA